MEESKQQQQQLILQMQQQQQLILQMQQQQQQLQQRQQQFIMMQHLQKQQQQTAMSRFPSNIDAQFRIQNRPVNPPLQNVNPNPNPNPNLIQQNNNFQQQQQNVMNQQRMMQQQQQQQKFMRPPSNQLEIQLAYQDAWRVCHPDFKLPFASLEDACERLLPYHVVADYEAEEDDRILDSDPTGQTLSRCQQWDNNIAAKVAEFTATFEKQAQAFNMITQKRSDGELRGEERLKIEQFLLQDERNACIELKLEDDRENNKAQEARLRMAAFAQATGQVRVAESQQAHNEMMARNPLRANAIGNHGEQQGRNLNPEEMMMMNGWGNNNNNKKREDKEPLEDFLNDEENENGEHDNWRRSGEFDLNTR